MSEGVEEVRIDAPVLLSRDGDGLLTLSFGPMTAKNLGLMMAHLGTPEGNADFHECLKSEIEKAAEEWADDE